jgi:hypothetical protein
VEELTFLVNSQRERPPGPELPPPPPVDVVVGESPVARPAKERSSLLAQDPRSAILRAREQYRARMSAELRHAEPAALATQASTPPSTPSVAAVGPVWTDRGAPAGAAVSGNPRSTDVPPVKLSELPRTFPTITSFPEDEAKFSTVPNPVEGLDLPRPGSSSRPEPPAPAGIVDADNAPVESTNSLSFATTSNGDLQSSDEREQLGRSRGGWRGRRERSGTAPWSVAPNADAAPPEEASGDLTEENATAVQAPPALEPGHPSGDVVAPGGDRSGSVFESGGDDDFDDTPGILRLVPDLSRLCRTCRDFRPADSGERGWCTNKWAFSHRRMVDADELPCLTSVGMWWLPHDDVWLQTADASGHGQPTPLVDQWLARRNGLAVADAVAAEPRRRQRS